MFRSVTCASPQSIRTSTQPRMKEIQTQTFDCLIYADRKQLISNRRLIVHPSLSHLEDVWEPGITAHSMLVSKRLGNLCLKLCNILTNFQFFFHGWNVNKKSNKTDAICHGINPIMNYCTSLLASGSNVGFRFQTLVTWMTVH